jgi:hypothetical protein
MNKRYDRINIDTLLDNYIPKVVNEQYPLLRALFKNYYEWASQEGFPYYNSDKLLDNAFIDTTIDKYLSYIYDELMSQFPEIEKDERFTLKNIRDLYTSKGITESFKYLSKLLFNESCTVFLPAEYLLKSSNGIYKKYYIFNTLDEVDNSIIGKTVLYEGNVYIVNNIVNKISNFSYHEIELILDNTKTPQQELTYTPLQCANNINIIDSGYNYIPGNTISLVENNTFLAYIHEVGNGEVDNLTITNGGINYEIGDVILLKNSNNLGTSAKFIVDGVDGSGAITSIEKIFSGSEFDEVPSIEIVTDNGTLATFDITHNINHIKRVSIIKTGVDIQPTDTIQINSIGTGAVLTFDVANIGFTIVSEQKSTTSGEYKIQDSFKWQDFSYILQTTKDLSKVNLDKLYNYRKYFTDIVHPAGQAMFNEIIIKDNISIETSNNLLYSSKSGILLEILFIHSKLSENFTFDQNLYEYKFTLIDDIKDYTFEDLTTVVNGSTIHIEDQ